VFGDVQQLSVELEAILCEEVAASQAVPQVHSPMFRVGAYAGDELIGWSYGWPERGNTFYMANSGAIASCRRRGIY
jgi:predicted GNAT superfamily acetyltransferase